MQKDGNRKILTETEFIYVEDKPYKLQFAAYGNQLSFWVNEEKKFCAQVMLLIHAEVQDLQSQKEL